MAKNHPITIDQFATFSDGFFVRDGELANDPPVPLDGYTAQMEIRPAPNTEPVYLRLTTENGGIEIDAPSGEVSFIITDEQSADLDFETAVYDLVLISPDGIVSRMIEGCVELSLGVTQVVANA